MNLDAIFRTLQEEKVRYMLIGGMNFFLRHEPVTTLDVDLWIEDSPENKGRVSRALAKLHAEWGRTESEWKVVSTDPKWLSGQGCFCLTSPVGAIDIFLDVKGLEGKFEECYLRSLGEVTVSGVPYVALADVDMMRCQEALPEGARKLDRIRILKSKLPDANRPEEA